MGDRAILETYLNSASKTTSEIDIFPRGTKSLLTSVTENNGYVSPENDFSFLTFCPPNELETFAEATLGCHTDRQPRAGREWAVGRGRKASSLFVPVVLGTFFFWL